MRTAHRRGHVVLKLIKGGMLHFFGFFVWGPLYGSSMLIVFPNAASVFQSLQVWTELRKELVHLRVDAAKGDEL